MDLSEIEKAVGDIHEIAKNVTLCYKPNEAQQKVLCFFATKEVSSLVR